MNKKLFTLLPLLALGLVACGEKPAPTPTKPDHGSLEQPLTVGELLAKEELQELEKDGETEQAYYVTGTTVSATCDGSAKTFKVTLGDPADEDATIQAYNVKPAANLVLEGEDDQGKWTYLATDAVKTATFIVKGKVFNYNGTLEFHGQHEGEVVSLEGATKIYKSTDTHGTVESDPLTYAEAAAKIAALSDGGTTIDKYYFKAKVSKLKTAPTTTYDNCGLLVSADGSATATDTIELFRCYLSGHAKTQAFIDWYGENVKVGGDVLVYGYLMKYGSKNTPEVSSGDFWLLDATGAKYGYVAA